MAVTTPEATTSAVTTPSLTTTSKVTTPEVTTTESTTREVTTPAVISMAVTTPEATTSAVTTPALTTTSKVTTPEVTTTESTTREVTTPAVTSMAVTTPETTTSAVTTPVLTTTSKVTTPEVTSTESTTREVTTPAVTSMAVTTPEATTSAVTTPALTTTFKVTTPEVTTTESTNSEVTTPAVTSMAVTTPEATTSAVTTPALTTTSKVTTPAVTTTENTTSEVTTPVVTSMAVTTPEVTSLSSSTISVRTQVKQETVITTLPFFTLHSTSALSSTVTPSIFTTSSLLPTLSPLITTSQKSSTMVTTMSTPPSSITPHGPCHDALGLQSGALLSSQIHPSSTELGNSVDNIRLNSLEDDNGFMAWSPDAEDSDPTVTFDLGHVLQVTGLALQGEGEEGSSFVKSFMVSVSVDNETYVNVSSNFNNVVFEGLNSSSEEQEVLFPTAILGRFIQFHVVSFHINPAVRMELLGCGSPVPVTEPTEIPRVCYQGEYQCGDSSCIKAFLVCDGICQCGDCSDEDYCGSSTTSTTTSEAAETTVFTTLPYESSTVYSTTGTNLTSETTTIILRTTETPFWCIWEEWSNWTDCSVTCGVGRRHRTRNLVRSENGTIDCLNATSSVELETDYCNTDSCPVVGEWSPWSNWTECDVTCGGGVSFRYRTCSNPPPKNGGKDCEGAANETKVCNPQECETNCSSGQIYSDCATACPAHCYDLAVGSQCVVEECQPGCHCPNGTLEQNGECVPQRQCDCTDENGNVYPPGSSLVDECRTCTCVNGVLECGDTECPVDCGWSSWSSWTECSVTCGNGTQQRFRSGNNPPAAYGGAECEGDSQEEQTCDAGDCPCGENEMWGNSCNILSCVDINANDSATTEVYCWNDHTCVCEPGWYRSQSGECVPQGECECLDEDGVIREAGDTWMSDNCTSCECKDGLVTCSTGCDEIICDKGYAPIFEDGECCPTCRRVSDPNSCSRLVELRNLTNSQGCTANDVEVPVCEGYCPSAAECGLEESEVIVTHSCSCCKPVLTGTYTTVEMVCPDGSTFTGKIPEIDSCMCHFSACNIS